MYHADERAEIMYDRARISIRQEFFNFFILIFFSPTHTAPLSPLAFIDGPALLKTVIASHTQRYVSAREIIV